MMTELDLARDYAELFPEGAARVLEHLPCADSAAFLARLDDTQRLRLIRQLLPSVAAHCLTALDEDITRELLRGLGPQNASVILRHLYTAQREIILQRLGTAQAYTIRHLLSYPDDTVGAWMHTQALAFPPDTTVAEVLDAIKRMQGDGQHRVYVVDTDQHLLGYVTLNELLRLTPQQTLAHHHHPAAHLLPARALMTSLRNHPAWRGATDLPVVEFDGRFVGMLSHQTLTRALEQQRHHSAGVGAGALAEAAVSAYWSGMQGLLHGLVGLLPGNATRPDRGA